MLGVLGSGYEEKLVGDVSPQTRLSDFSLSVRFEVDTADFGCSECAGGCGTCGWAAGHSAQFVVDVDGRHVARLTNDTHQLGTLWAAQPQRSATVVPPLTHPVSADEHWQSTGATGGEGGEGQPPHVTGQALAWPY